MNKRLFLLPVLGLFGACAQTKDLTLQDMIYLYGDGAEAEFKPIEQKEQNVVVEEVVYDDAQNQVAQIVTADVGTYELPSYEERAAYQPYEMPPPEIYATVAARVADKILDDTREIHELNDNTFIYISALIKTDKTLPDGIYAADRTLRKIIEGSGTFRVTNNKSEADYILYSELSRGFDTSVPMVVYKLVLTDKDNNLINEWKETVRQVDNDDRSWW